MSMTNEELLNLFEKTAKTNSYKLSENTIDRYKYYINSLIKFYDGKSILEITNDDIVNYTIELQSSDSYLNANLSAFRTLYDILFYHPKSKYLMKQNPTIGVKGAKRVENKKEQIILSTYQQSMLIKYAKNKRDKAILMVYLSTGVRVCELISLTLTQYNNRTEDNCIELTVTKGSHNRNIWLSDDVVEAIDDYLLDRKQTECDNLFISNGGQPMDRSCLSRTLKTIAKRTNIFSDSEISKIANHSMRRSISSTLLNDKDIPIDVVAKLLGHSNLGSVMRYAKTSQDRVKMAMIGLKKLLTN